jgi:hypothetical protein
MNVPPVRKGRSLVAATALLATLALGAAACGGGASGSGGSGGSGGAPASTASSSPSSAPKASSSGAAAGAKTVAVGLGEWYIDIGGTKLAKGATGGSVPAGSVTFDVKNDGKIVHALEISGQGVDEKTGDVQPGQSAKLTVDLKPGKYEVWCPIPGHKQAGMDGYVQVQ